MRILRRERLPATGGADRSGCATDQLSVEFPPINGDKGRAYDYEVTVGQECQALVIERISQ